MIDARARDNRRGLPTGHQRVHDSDNSKPDMNPNTVTA